MTRLHPVDVLPRRTILEGDALTRLRSLPSGQIDTVVTSPPYFRLRDYGHADQTGLEGHVDDWVKDICSVMYEVARVLVPTGSVWLNVGDSYSTHHREGAPKKSLVGAPERLLLGLIGDGWIVRNKVVWAKTNPTPSSVRDRLTCTYEVIYLLVRRQSYYFDLDSIRKPLRSPASQAARKTASAVNPTKEGRPEWLGPNADAGQGLEAMHQRGIAGHPLGKNPGDVWRLSTSRYKGAHFATFPEHLVAPMLRATCPERRCRTCRAPWHRPLRRLGALATRLALQPTCTCHDDAEVAQRHSEPGLVLDPYMGAGTSALAALHQGKDWLGIELNPEFIHLAEMRIQAAKQQQTKGGAYA